MGVFVYFVCIAVAGFGIVAQPAVAQGVNLTLPLTYPGRVLQEDGSQTCSSETREMLRNEITNAERRLVRESPIPLLHYSCGGSSGWRRIAYLNMSNPSQQCPSVWRELITPHRVCGRRSIASGASCEGVTYTTGSEQYDQVCGRITGYQIGTEYAFIDGPNVSINTSMSMVLV